MNPPSFFLSKWYMDVIADTGETFIGYSASVDWKKMNLRYSGYLHLDTAGRVNAKSSFAEDAAPVMTGNRLSWTSRFCDGHWDSVDTGIEQMLLEDSNGYIKWSCLLPKSHGTVSSNGTTLQGLGYAEKIEMTIPPWKLPIRQLYWGRFLSVTNTIIWIEWKGPLPKTLIYFNGKLCGTGTIDDRRIEFEGNEVMLHTPTSLRSGSIGATVFSGVKKIISLFPVSIFRMDENKWTGVATLTRAGLPADSGNFIHERVMW